MALDNFIPQNGMAQCNKCRKYRKGKFVCEVYAEWIPRQKPMGNCKYFEPKEETK